MKAGRLAFLLMFFCAPCFFQPGAPGDLRFVLDVNGYFE